MHILKYIMHTSGFAKFWCSSLLVVYNLHLMLDVGQLGFSCPVNWKQSSFVGPGLLISNNDYQVHIDDKMFKKDVLLMMIAQTSNPSINP